MSECKNRIGWLRRDGKHFECCSREHEQKAKELGFDEESLEEMGFVKIFINARGGYYCCKEMTEQQIKWLFDNELLEDYMIKQYEKVGIL